MTYPPASSGLDVLSEATALVSRDQPDAIHCARKFVRRRCAELGFDETLCYTASLLTSEAVTNALLHAGNRALLTVTAASEGLLVEVEDEGPLLPDHPLAPDPDALGGRGLHIVDELSSGWGSYPHGHGKVVWFHLAAS